MPEFPRIHTIPIQPNPMEARAKAYREKLWQNWLNSPKGIGAVKACAKKERKHKEIFGY